MRLDRRAGSGQPQPSALSGTMMAACDSTKLVKEPAHPYHIIAILSTLPSGPIRRYSPRMRVGNKPAGPPVSSRSFTTPIGREEMADHDGKELSPGGNIDRRGLLKCMSWAGTGLLWTVSGGVPRSLGLVGEAMAAEAPAGDLTFLQISD